MKKLCAVLLLSQGVLWCQSADDNLKLKTEIGYMKTTGNTDTEAFSLDFNGKKTYEKHSFELLLDGSYAEDEGYEIRNKFTLEGNYNYKMKKNLFLTYLVGYKEDKFSSYDYQFYTGPGIKYQFIKSDKQNLSLEGSFLYAQDEYSQIQRDINGDPIDYPNKNNTPVVSTTPSSTDEYGSYRIKGLYDLRIVENLKFEQSLTYRGDMSDNSNFFINSKSAFVNKITDTISASVSYKVDYANEPTDGNEKEDTALSFNLIFNY